MVINQENLYSMLTSSDSDDIELGMSVSKYYRGNNRKLKTLIRFYKEIRKMDIPLTMNFEYLDLRDNKSIIELPEGLTCEQLRLACSNVYRLPNNLTCDELFCNDSFISEIPYNLIVNDLFYVKGSPLERKFQFRDNLIEEIERKGGKWGHLKMSSWESVLSMDLDYKPYNKKEEK